MLLWPRDYRFLSAPIEQNLNLTSPTWNRRRLRYPDQQHNLKDHVILTMNDSVQRDTARSMNSCESVDSFIVWYEEMTRDFASCVARSRLQLMIGGMIPTFMQIRAYSEKLNSASVPVITSGHAPARFTSFALFLGVSMSVTAFTVLARILTDRGIHKTRMGVQSR